VVSLKAAHSSRLAEIWGGQFPRSAAKLLAMLGAGLIEPPVLMTARADDWALECARRAPSPACWHSTRPCTNWLWQSCRGAMVALGRVAFYWTRTFPLHPEAAIALANAFGVQREFD
jgi:hypothetical protein